MGDLVFNIEQVFSTEQRNGILGKNEVEKYYIPPYQRGYKWKSKGQNAWVKVLLTDLLDSYNSNEPEYYLQYITVKKRTYKEAEVLEVIDGQQRITTLIVLLSVILYKQNDTDTSHNIAYDKLVYGIRDRVQDFLDLFVYEGVDRILHTSWDSFTESNPDYDEQDIYYLFSAANKIAELLPQDTERLDDFTNFLKNRVLLILNLVDQNTSSEKIFSNLNSNKVDLTSTELIKALILTKSSREAIIEEYQNYKELMELRAMMGRQWDEISRWVNREDVKSFYFEYDNAMNQLLTLVALRDNYKPPSERSEYHLFDFFQAKIKRGEKAAQHYFNNLKLIYSLFKDWFGDNESYNRLGFLFSVQGSSFDKKSIIDFCEKDKVDLRSELLSLSIEQIPEAVTELEYGHDNLNIRDVLLALSIFANDKDYRFDFHSFRQERWSLEHIFPQNPEELSNDLGKKDIEILNSLLKTAEHDFSKLCEEGETVYDVKLMYKTLSQKLNWDASCNISDRDKRLLYRLIRSDKLNSIGNMALLTKSDNSSNRNGMFDYKRRNVASRISNGSFVPKHTYDVFSKLISGDFNPDLTVWSEKDIETHTNWIGEKISMLKKGNT
jgi:hypothetical protein